MAKIKRHWKSVFLCFAICSVGGWLIATSLIAEDSLPAQKLPVEQSTSPKVTTALSPEVFCAVRDLRKKFALNNQDLAAMGCTEIQAKEILNTLLVWYKTSKIDLDAAQRAEDVAMRNLRQAVRKINMGSKDASDSDVRRLHKELAAIRKRHETLKSGVIAVVGKKLTKEQGSFWEAIRANIHAPAKYRYVTGLTPKQMVQLRKAYRNKIRRATIAKSAVEKDQANSVLRNKEAKVLGHRQMSTLGTVDSTAKLRIAGVMKASQIVLPTPAELKAPQLSGDDLRNMSKLQGFRGLRKLKD